MLHRCEETAVFALPATTGIINRSGFQQGKYMIFLIVVRWLTRPIIQSPPLGHKNLAGNVCMLRINVLLEILLIYGLSTHGAMTPIVYLIWMWNPTNIVKAKSQLFGFPVRMYCWDRCIISVYFFTHCSNLYAFLNTYYHTQGHTGMFVIVLKEPPPQNLVTHKSFIIWNGKKNQSFI